MNYFNQAHGRMGESVAAAYLERKGFYIIEQNAEFHDKETGKKIAEVDIIASKNKGAEIHFVEVKYRKTTDYGTGAMAVGKAKQKNVKNGAMRWLMLSKLYDSVIVSFDVVEVSGDAPDFEINHYENCFY
ncbi:MAG: YraN family protein [Christensenellaceae bacterium]|jgi:putative endonuclease|nr:YraN family protein [Christensenellaceae bacterium]